MEYINISDTDMKASRIGFGGWPIGGSSWGGSDDYDSIRTIHAALGQGINLIDTAADYGKGHSEELIGKALKETGNRDKVLIAGKPGLNWKKGPIFRDGSKERITSEINDTLTRLGTDYLDVYIVHWPDPLVPIEETAEAMKELYDAGKIRAIGVSNFSVEQMEQFKKVAPLHVAEPPYNMFERDAEKQIIPYCIQNNITPFLYSSICRGLLSGKMTKSRKFNQGDMRKEQDPKFQEPHFSQYLATVDELKTFAKERFNRPVIDLAVRWVLDKSVTGIALRGVRHPDQLETPNQIDDWILTEEDMEDIDKILNKYIEEPIGRPTFMAPPTKEQVNV
ncbi:aldo/keto reductase [Terrilactibacillus laevilacticus]|uniref:Aldo/keto reductase n=1 Tax=Terrilactibacillus laevilacticus TaxID=1380157 RepID=A0ABW5PNK6_9BACI|nr:aldo/keto reductase [Terrilactibacillus laevilacticus]